jgi:DNA-directed RNA polymerase specialized sigma24 family protein
VALAPRADTWAADEAVTHLFTAHYRPLVRLATLLLHESSAAEEIVQDAYVNRSRSALRHRKVVDRHLAMSSPEPDAPSAEAGALVLLQHAAVVRALRALPNRQREALVLRYYLDLSEADIAETMGCSRGAVKSHCSRGMAALRETLERAS